MNNVKESKLNWINVVLVALGELILGLFIFQLYPMMSMLFFGEGGGSLLYSSGNSVSWALMPVLVPTIINIVNIQKAAKNKNLIRLKAFRIIQLILLVFYFPFIIWRFFYFGFHI